MKRIIIICEGPTEVEFCKELLYPHLLDFGIIIQWALPGWSGGGEIAWSKLHKQILATLKQDSTAIVTTFVDFYGLQKPTLFPNWDEAILIKADPYKRIELLEQGMMDSIPENIRHRFIPNIILHEFEGLLFNDIVHFENLYNYNEFKNKAALINVLSEFENPELINEIRETSPSHRLKNDIFIKFSKPIDGIIIALDINLNKIRQKSLHFNDWIAKMENI